jgi:hypothetical protein
MVLQGIRIKPTVVIRLSEIKRHKKMKNTNKVIHAPSKPPQILIFTGSGVSAESGIPTYREKDGL